jgi:hypothetical protein
MKVVHGDQQRLKISFLVDGLLWVVKLKILKIYTTN